MILKGKRVLVIGAGKTGVAVTRSLYGMGAFITLTDIKKEFLLRDVLEEFKDTPIKIVAGKYPEVNSGNTDLVIISPGVPLDILPVKQALKEGIPVWSEIELAFRMFDAPVIAVTGTNGKTTTTALIGAMFEDAGWPVVVAGNIGVPLIEKVPEITPEHVVVLEVSSFQLECIDTFRSRVAVVLNLTPDHLDRHKTFEEYVGAKQRIFANQNDSDYSILNYNDKNVRAMASFTRGRVIFFSINHTLEQGAYLLGGNLFLALDGEVTLLCNREEIFIKGEHNVQNALAAALAARIMGLKAENIRETLKNFRGVAHRLEFVDEIEGVKYVNDSKGTNPDASIRALKAFEEPIILIAGGKNKGSDFSKFAGVVKEKAKAVIVLGEAADEIHEAVSRRGFDSIYKVNSLGEAVAKAYEIALPGEVVLLSPACASWDMFRNYEERGELFKKLVASLRR